MVDNLSGDDYDITTVFGLDLSAVGSIGSLPTTPEGLIASANVSGDVQGVLSQIASAPGFGTLGAGALGAIGSVVSKVAMAGPAIDMISSIASGHGPTDPQQVVGALAATASIANPLAGAIIGAAGEVAIGIENAAEEFFQSVGLIDRPPPQFTYIGFVKKSDGAPSGPSDPHWKTWDYWMTPVNQGWRWGTLPFTAESVQRERPFQLILERLGRYHPPVSSLTPPHNGPIPQNGFETYYFAILEKDLENWMNAGPAMDPRQLLLAAAQVWNAKHSPSVVKKYSGFVSGAGASSDNSLAHPIDFILSAAGDTSSNGMQGFGSLGPDLTINLGDIVAPKRTISLAGIGKAVAPKQSVPLVGKPAAVMSSLAKPPAPVTNQSLWQKFLPYAPAAAGIAAFPFIGPLAPAAGVLVSALIVGSKRA